MLLIDPSPLSNLLYLEYFQQLVSEHFGSQDKVWQLEQRSKSMEIFWLEKAIENEKLINERMIKSQEDVNQLNQQNEKYFHKQKGKAGLGYNK